MKKKILSVILAVVLAFSVPLSASAKSFAPPSINEFVTTLISDQKRSFESMGALSKLSVKLMVSMLPYLKNVVFTAENLETVTELGEQLTVKLYQASENKINSSAQKIKDGIEELKERFNPVKPTEQPTAEPVTVKPTEPASEPSSGEETTTAAPETTTEAPDPLKGYTLYEATEIFKDYIVVRIDDPDELAKIIAENSNFSYHTVENDGGTLFISVNISENPELFNYPVFRKTVEELCIKQDAELLTDKYGKVDYLMTYRHIAGELALHMFLFAAVNDIIQITGSRNRTLVNLFLSAATADLNINESRLPTESLSILGILLIDMIHFNTLRLLGLF